MAFIAYCLHVTLRARLRPLAPGLTQLPRFGFFLGPFGGGFQQLTAREGAILKDRFIISVRKKPFIVTNLS